MNYTTVSYLTLQFHLYYTIGIVYTVFYYCIMDLTLLLYSLLR